MHLNFFSLLTVLVYLLSFFLYFGGLVLVLVLIIKYQRKNRK